ncbi:unnamed protein product [Tuber melanosporum]|uniref:(Perigord truffle) hypothetical protein n=1 Tax=Tuber melanosporum (strain Mel28) TaxID=656061 RepID=D5GJW0_TUBMM|nr:uncharacterized protein GSTUM_00009230001 [Tuber melanosporum]CAZ84803.1 unnamed protein product [Tuber melanosporum]
MASKQVQWPQRLASFPTLIWPHLTMVNLLRLVWLSTVYYDERQVYKSAMAACYWNNWENWGPETVPHRIVLVADPQIVDRHTYAHRGIALSAAIFYTDLYMSRSYDSIIDHLNPSTVIFLGDLFDGGREWELTDDYWLSEYARFSKVFPSTPYRRTVQSLPGNHDIGVGNGIKESVLERFRLFFGEGNSLLALGNHSIILLDTPSLLNDVNPRIHNPPRDFLDSLPDLLSPNPPLPPHIIQNSSIPASPSPEQTNLNPVILLSHIPLHRPADTPCGPRRQSQKPIRIGGGYQYTNTLPELLSQEILHKTGAKHVFSGDDHDSCTVAHEYDDGKQKAEEVTVRTFAWTMGVRQPGFLMVSLLNDGLRDGKETVLVHECLLPDQIGIYLGYVELVVHTLVIVLLNMVRRRGGVWWWCRCLRPRGGEGEDKGKREGLLGIVQSERGAGMEGGVGKKQNRECCREFFGDLRDLVIVVVPFYLALLVLW